MPKLPAPLSPVEARQGPRIDMTAILLNIDQEPLADDFGVPPGDQRRTTEEGIAKLPRLTLGRAAWHALFAQLPGDDRLTGEDRWAYGTLAERIRDDPAAALTAQEVALLKKRIGTTYSAEVVMRAMPLLDPNAKPPEIK